MKRVKTSAMRKSITVRNPNPGRAALPRRPIFRPAFCVVPSRPPAPLCYLRLLLFNPHSALIPRLSGLILPNPHKNYFRSSSPGLPNMKNDQTNPFCDPEFFYNCNGLSLSRTKPSQKTNPNSTLCSFDVQRSMFDVPTALPSKCVKLDKGGSP